MFENIISIFKKNKKGKSLNLSSKNTAKERLHLVLMQDRANVSADFLDLMRKEIIEVIKKYIDIDEKSMDVRLTTETNEDGTQGAPALYANIPIINIKDETRKLSRTNQDHKIEIKLTEKIEDNISEETEENKQDINQEPNEIKDDENNISTDESKEDETNPNIKDIIKDQDNIKTDEKSSQNKEEEDNNNEE